MNVRHCTKFKATPCLNFSFSQISNDGNLINGRIGAYLQENYPLRHFNFCTYVTRLNDCLNLRDTNSVN